MQIGSMMVSAVAAVFSLVAAVGHLLHIATFSFSVCQVSSMMVAAVFNIQPGSSCQLLYVG